MPLELEQLVVKQREEKGLQEVRKCSKVDPFLFGSFASSFAVLGLPYFFPTYVRTFLESKKTIEEKVLEENSLPNHSAFAWGVNMGTIYGLSYHALTSIGYYAALVQETYGPLLFPLATNALSVLYELGRGVFQKTRGV